MFMGSRVALALGRLAYVAFIVRHSAGGQPERKDD